MDSSEEPPNLANLSSWAAYDSQNLNQNTGHREIERTESALPSCLIDSNTSGRRETNLALGSIASSAVDAAARASGPAGGAQCGLEALYVASPDYIETHLKFQWMRVHPAAVLSVDHCGISSGHAAESSKFVGRFREAKEAQRTQKKRKMPIPRRERNKDDFLCGMSEGEVRLDLSNLINPPLMSEWIPGVNTSIAYDSESDDESIESCIESERNGSVPGSAPKDHTKTSENPLDPKAIIDALVNAATKDVMSGTSSGKSLKDAVASCELFESLKPLENVSFDMLIEYISSQRLARAIVKAEASLREKDEQCYRSFSLPLGVAALFLLAENFSSKTIGRFILSILAPALLTNLSNERTFQHEETAEERRSIQLRMRRLANALIEKCSLWTLPKSELLTLTTLDGSEQPLSTEFRELVCCVGESYFLSRRS